MRLRPSLTATFPRQTYLLSPCDWRDVEATLLADESGEAQTIRSRGSEVANAHVKG
jgi:hypothetical protein